MVTNDPFVGRVEKGVETSVYITEFNVIRILGYSLTTVNGHMKGTKGILSTP